MILPVTVTCSTRASVSAHLRHLVSVSLRLSPHLSISLRVSPEPTGQRVELGALQERTEHWPLARPTYTTRRRAHLTWHQLINHIPQVSSLQNVDCLLEKQLVTWSERGQRLTM